MSFSYRPYEKDAFEDCLRHAYTLVLLCDGPEQEDSVKPRFIADSWYERRPESGLRHASGHRDSIVMGAACGRPFLLLTHSLAPLIPRFIIQKYNSGDSG